MQSSLKLFKERVLQSKPNERYSSRRAAVRTRFVLYRSIRFCSVCVYNKKYVTR